MVFTENQNGRKKPFFQDFLLSKILSNKKKTYDKLF